jgi:hypothetical protein
MVSRMILKQLGLGEVKPQPSPQTVKRQALFTEPPIDYLASQVLLSDNGPYVDLSAPACRARDAERSDLPTDPSGQAGAQAGPVSPAALPEPEINVRFGGCTSLALRSKRRPSAKIRLRGLSVDSAPYHPVRPLLSQTSSRPTGCCLSACCSDSIELYFLPISEKGGGLRMKKWRL